MAEKAEYQAGNLQLQLLGVSDSAVSSINNTIKALNSLSRAVKKVAEANTVFAGQKIGLLFERISDATKSLDTTKLTTLASAAKSLSSISRISTIGNINFDKVSKGFENLTTAITPFIDKVKEAESSLNAMYGIMNKAGGKKLQNLLNNQPSGGGGGGSRALSFFGTTISLYGFYRLGGVVAKIAQSGADYAETLNLWEVAMGDNVDLATKFVDKMNEAYGISEKTLMNAQATFKNMIGSLGQVSQSTAYALSEGITQMAIDYASLYNVQFERAFSKFQAVLAGQVRPIRTESGFDVTETTLFQLYESLGGTKTMRQLTRTDKQLLSILSIYQQMTRSGAVGDLSKTMESYANQSRVMAEAWNEVVTYAGTLLTFAIQESGILTYINAALIFAGETLKAVAENLGAIQSFGDPFAEVSEGLGLSIDAADELNGKLAEFDKFRSLSGAGQGDIALDTRLIEALSSYTTILGNATLEARELAKSFGTMTGLFDADGNLNLENWKKFSTILESTVITVTTFFGAWLAISIIKFFVSPLGLAVTAISSLVFGISMFINAWDDMTGLQKVLGIIGSLAAAITATAVALKLLQGNWAAALSIGGIVGGAWIGTAALLANPIQDYATGGLPDKGTVFRAGEAGAEIVYNTPSGQSGVANVQQIAQATYNGTIKALNDWWGGSNAKKDVPQLSEASATGMYEAVTGVARSQGNTWSRAR